MLFSNASGKNAPRRDPNLKCAPIPAKDIKRLQAVELSILEQVVRFCDEHGIQYCLSSGSLLGAVKYAGFIPWDDDVDIAMPRDDLERFLSLSGQLPPDLVCQATRFDSSYPIPQVKIRKKGTLMKEPMFAHLDMEHGVWIDIFPIDEVPSREAVVKNAKRANILTTAISYKLGSMLPKKPLTVLTCRLLGLLGIPRLDRLRTRVMAKYNHCGSGLYTNYVSNLGPTTLLFDKSVYFPLKKIPFEGIPVSVPADSDRWLRSAYGDYRQDLPPEQQVNTHRITEYRF